MLIDEFVRERTGGEMRMDENGKFAAAGTPDDHLLSEMLSDPYFAMSPPKSTGRERFGEHFLTQYSAALGRLSLEDGTATLTALTAHGVARAVRDVRLADAHILCSGGGARNPSLVRDIQALLPGALLDPTDVAGIPVDAKEAIAFAVLGYETLRERPANVPQVTGAAHAVPLGAIAPHGLRELLVEVEAECLSS
jgi:anhydro-N-acetylmuramic acid kinase